jgi:hypothetical protein
MDQTPPPFLDDDRQRVLEQNVFASAKNSELQLVELRRIAGAMSVIKWAAVLVAAFLALLLFR